MSDINQAHLEKFKSLPEGWTESSVSELVQMVSTNKKKLAQKKYIDEGTFPVIDQGQLFIGGYSNDKNLVLEEDPPFIVFGDHTRAFKFANFQFIPGADGVKVMRPLGVDPKWCFYIFQAIKLPNKGYARHFQYLKEAYVPVPPPNQQKYIVAKIEELFSHIDAGIESLKKAKQLLKQYRQSVLRAAVTGELTKEWRQANKAKLEPTSQLLERIGVDRNQEFNRKLKAWEGKLTEWKIKGEKGKKPAKPRRPKVLEPISNEETNSLGNLPEGWAWARLGNLTVYVFDGPFGSNLKSRDYVDEGIRVIRLENIGNLEFKGQKESFITPKKYELLSKHTVSTGDLIFSSFVANGTRVVVLPKQIEKAINKADCFCVRCYGNAVNNYYLSLFLATNTAYKRLENQVHGATRPRINTTQLKNIAIPICSIEEQKEAVRILELKFEAIDRIEREISEKMLMVDTNKQSVLVSAFNEGLS